MNSPIEAIKQAVAENRTGDALSRLLELTQNNKQLHDAIHIVLAEFNDLQNQRIRGIISNEEAARRLSAIYNKIFVALEGLENEIKTTPIVTRPPIQPSNPPVRKSPEATSIITGHSSRLLLKVGSSLLIFALITGALLYERLYKSNDDDLLVYFIATYYIGVAGVVVLGGWLLSVVFNAIKGK